MPLYEFRCASCGHELEVLQKMSAPAPVDCPACKQASLQKKLTAAGFQLKGTGWYVTDFRGGNSPSAETATKNNGEPSAAASDKAESSVAKTETPVAQAQSQTSSSTTAETRSSASTTQTSSTTPSAASA